MIASLCKCLRVDKYNEDIRDEHIKRIHDLSTYFVDFGCVILLPFLSLFFVSLSSDLVYVLALLLLLIKQFLRPSAEDEEDKKNKWPVDRTWIEAHLFLWLYWTLYSFGEYAVYNRVGTRVPSHALFHILVSVLVMGTGPWVAAYAPEFGQAWWTRLYLLLLDLATVLPFGYNVLFESVWRGVVRNLLAALLYCLLRTWWDPQIPHTNLKIHVSLYYIFFGYFDLTLILAAIHILLLSILLFKEFVLAVRTRRESPEEDDDDDEEEQQPKRKKKAKQSTL